MQQNQTETKKTQDRPEAAQSQGPANENKSAADKNKTNLMTEASQKGKSVDRDITDPATEPEE